MTPHFPLRPLLTGLLTTVVCLDTLIGRALAQRPSRGTPAPPAGRDAFMALPSTSASDLARRIASDPKLLNAYAKHFGVDAKRIPAFVKDALVLRPLTKSKGRGYIWAHINWSCISGPTDFAGGFSGLDDTRWKRLAEVEMYQSSRA